MYIKFIKVGNLSTPLKTFISAHSYFRNSLVSSQSTTKLAKLTFIFGTKVGERYWHHQHNWSKGVVWNLNLKLSNMLHFKI